MKYLPLNKQIFIDNRKRFMKEMKPNSIAIFVSNDEWPSNGDALHTFKQNTDLYWLSGIEQEDSMVVLFPNCPDPKYREVLVLVRPNELKEKWDGKRLRTADGTAISGIQTIVWLDAIDAMLQTWVHLADTIYLDTNENDRKATDVASRDYRFVAEMKARYPLHGYERAAKIMRTLRAVKSKEEVAVIGKAIDITDQTFRHLLGFIKPGVTEYEIEAEIYHQFLKRRATGPAYHSIIASGDRARTLHYVSNNQVCEAGEMLLMDFGAEYANYASDLTRTIPVSGKFTKRQKNVYNAVLRIMKESTKLLVAGNTLQEYNNEVRALIERELLKLKLISKTDISREDPKNPAFRKYFMHGISHFMGLDVHDLGNRKQPFQEGMIFTCEPGIYIPEEKLGIRIENDILITAKGPKDLMKKIPVEVEEIEELMNKK